MSQIQEERAARWNPQQATILNLYVTQKLPLQDVMAHMEREHQFHASKADYEAQWKVWAIRKNMSSAEWDFLRYRLGKRERESKESEVYRQGKLVPEKKLKKQLSQRFLPTFKGYPSPASNPETPPGISIRTPREIDSPSDDDQRAPSVGRIISHRNQGLPKQGETMYQGALAGYEETLGPHHPSTLGTVNDLGLLMDQGKMAEAVAMYQRALAGKEKVPGPDHTSTFDTVNNLGILYMNQGKMAEAEGMYQRALTGKEKALGPDHTSTLSTVYNLGNFYRDLEKMA